MDTSRYSSFCNADNIPHSSGEKWTATSAKVMVPCSKKYQRQTISSFHPLLKCAIHRQVCLIFHQPSPHIFQTFDLPPPSTFMLLSKQSPRLRQHITLCACSVEGRACTLAPSLQGYAGHCRVSQPQSSHPAALLEAWPGRHHRVFSDISSGVKQIYAISTSCGKEFRKLVTYWVKKCFLRHHGHKLLKGE